MRPRLHVRERIAHMCARAFAYMCATHHELQRYCKKYPHGGGFTMATDRLSQIAGFCCPVASGNTGVAGGLTWPAAQREPRRGTEVMPGGPRATDGGGVHRGR
jgi:hypothetical protein